MNYLTVLPNNLNEMTLGTPHGHIVVKNGQIIPESVVTLSYPNFFIKLEEPKITETIQIENSTQIPVERKKPGRPRKNF